MAAKHMGSLPRNIARQPSSSTSSPPPSEPVIMPNVPSAAIMPSARPLKSGGNKRVTIAGANAMSNPLPNA